MKPFYFLARTCLAWVFVQAGLDVLRHPAARAKAARPFLEQVRGVSPLPLPHDIALVRANAALHLAAGGAMALGARPRLAASALMVSLVPTTWGGHAFWAATDTGTRAAHRSHFAKNLSIFGGLMLVVLTGGRPRR